MVQTYRVIHYTILMLKSKGYIRENNLNIRLCLVFGVDHIGNCLQRGTTLKKVG